MQRTKVPVVVLPELVRIPVKEYVPILQDKNNVIQWKQTGRGTLRLKSGVVIKPNEVFKALVSEIPIAFRDTVIPLDKLPGEENAVLEVPTSVYLVREITPESGNYEVLDSRGKIISEGNLTKEDAENLVKQLQG